MHVELSTIVIAAAFFSMLSAIMLICYFIDRRRKEKLAILAEEAKSTPINYPLPPMFPNYLRIKNDLKLCATKSQLNEQYIAVLLFSCYYKDSDTFINELVDLYNSVEAEYSNPT